MLLPKFKNSIKYGLIITLVFDDTFDSLIVSEISFYFITILLVFSYFISANFEVRRIYNSKKITLQKI